MKTYLKSVFVIILTIALACSQKEQAGEKKQKTPIVSGDWTQSFDIEKRDFATSGENLYFNLQPGYQLILEGNEDSQHVKLIISVLWETQKIGNVETRIVEERELVDGNLIEVSRNFFAIDRNSLDVFYFGEEVDIYKNGSIVGHGGAWRADESGNRAGMMMPGKIEIGARYYQEIAPGVAMDRAEIVNQQMILETPSGTFENCLKIEETTPLEPDAKEYKIYAPEIGLIKDGSLLLTEYGFKK